MTDFDIEEVRQARARERDKSSLVALADPSVLDRAEDAEDVDEELLDDLTTELVNLRLSKVIKLASFAAAGHPTENEGMTDREAELFDDLEARIVEHRDAAVVATEGDDL